MSCKGGGNFITGLRGNWKDDKVVAIGPVCSKDNADSAIVGSGGTPFAFDCPAGSFVSGVGSDKVTCRSLQGKESVHQVPGIKSSTTGWSSTVPTGQRPKTAKIFAGRIELGSEVDDDTGLFSNLGDYKLKNGMLVSKRRQTTGSNRGQDGPLPPPTTIVTVVPKMPPVLTIVTLVLALATVRSMSR